MPFPIYDTRDLGIHRQHDRLSDLPLPHSPPATTEHTEEFTSQYGRIQQPTEDEINQYTNEYSLNEPLIRRTINRLLVDKTTHLHAKERKFLIWFAKTLETKSILDLQATPDERKRWTFHAANSIFQEYSWYHWACKRRD